MKNLKTMMTAIGLAAALCFGAIGAQAQVKAPENGKGGKVRIELPNIFGGGEKSAWAEDSDLAAAQADVARLTGELETANGRVAALEKELADLRVVADGYKATAKEKSGLLDAAVTRIAGPCRIVGIVIPAYKKYLETEGEVGAVISIALRGNSSTYAADFAKCNSSAETKALGEDGNTSAIKVAYHGPVGTYVSIPTAVDAQLRFQNTAAGISDPITVNIRKDATAARIVVE